MSSFSCKLCDFENCTSTKIVELSVSESQEVSSRRGRNIKKLCESHHYFEIIKKKKKGSKKTASAKIKSKCCDPNNTHIDNTEGKHTIKEEFHEDIFGICR